MRAEVKRTDFEKDHERQYSFVLYRGAYAEQREGYRPMFTFGEQSRRVCYQGQR